MQKMICCIDWTFRHSHKYRVGDWVGQARRGMFAIRQTVDRRWNASKLCVVSLCKDGMMQRGGSQANIWGEIQSTLGQAEQLTGSWARPTSLLLQQQSSSHKQGKSRKSVWKENGFMKAHTMTQWCTLTDSSRAVAGMHFSDNWLFIQQHKYCKGKCSNTWSSRNWLIKAEKYEQWDHSIQYQLSTRIHCIFSNVTNKFLQIRIDEKYQSEKSDEEEN